MAAVVTPERRDALAPPARATLERLGESNREEAFYLAGGAALTLYLGHRTAHGLDLMSATNRLLPPDRRDLLQALLAGEPTTRVETARDGYLFVHEPDGVAVRFYWYPYPLVEPLEAVAGLPVASLLDLVLMKLGALISRGHRRDFVELHLADRVLPLADAFARAEEKFGHVGDFELQARKALADLGAAEDDPMPRLAEALDWATVRDWALAEAAKGGREALGG